MKDYRMWIDGEWVEAISKKTYPVFDPVTEEEITQLPLGDKEDVDKAVKSARKAFPVWSKKSTDERAEILMQISASLKEHVQELAELEVLDHGAPIGQATMWARSAAQFFAESAVLSKTFMESAMAISNIPNSFPYYKREPIGVCACIVPWNIPMYIAAKISAALATGNTCVVKPASVDSLTTLRMAEIISKHNLPPGTINVVTGPGETVGTALASHPGIDMVSFTGSCKTGKDIMAAASQTIKRLFLELGGKNPFIVLDDADLDAATTRAAACQSLNSGMQCRSPGRYYIHEKIYDEFLSKFTAKFKAVVVGDPKDQKTQMGPVVSAEHRDRIENYIKIGVEEGAKLVMGGQRPNTPPLNKGYYVMPTIFTDVTQNMRIAREEIFGPVACILKFSSDDEVINAANDNTFGLAASVWTKNLVKARRFADQLQAGLVWVNTHQTYFGGQGGLPMGGFKESGFGKEGSILGLEEYSQLKVISINMTE
jgi:acyl-CoA reductase-like NAD-dependent aldehyde dehydrogenase